MIFPDHILHLLFWLNSTLTPLGCLLTAGFLTCLLLILRTVKKYRMMLDISRLPDQTEEDADMRAVAGDDVIMAQLDLARAYIEMGSKDRASAVLSTIARQGTPAQQKDAARLQSELTG